MGRWLRLVSKTTLGQHSFRRSRMDWGANRKRSVSGRLLPAASSSHASLVQACSTHNSSSYLIPTTSATVRCTGDIADGLMEALMSFGASSVSIEDGAPTDNAVQENFEGPVAWSNERRKLWNQCELIALFPPGHDVEECLALAFNSVGLKEKLTYRLSEVQHQNWEQQVKDLFQPLKISESLWIIPQWSSPPDSSATNIILDPGLAFGTGDHPTTQLCLRWLNNVMKGGEEILDYGTGSGILAIAALKAVGVDIDPMAISSATHNASLNGYGPDSLRLLNAPSSGNESIPVIDAKYDIVVANLLLNPLLLLSECLLSYTKPGGQLGLSGILKSQVDQVREAYGLHLDNMSVGIQDGWACLSGTKSFP
ncbi:hypothetical protein GOP47_0000053 [Adiantum capillus-veneris]|uniref:ETFB lysine methyltransferase n=1 Tax=Adiantum capillus-veneris TaxID=13818 RepID=A0A9D4VD60_ADICA|nr:hypothetical protein GOP47_0000053 [Adiantum capillus-veneris]